MTDDRVALKRAVAMFSESNAGIIEQLERLQARLGGTDRDRRMPPDDDDDDEYQLTR